MEWKGWWRGGPVVAGFLISGCTAVLRGGGADFPIHGWVTYDRAVAAGWRPDQAGAIAAANVETDLHPETNSVATERRIVGGMVNPVTLPWILGAGAWDIVVTGLPPSRAVGRRTAEITAWTLSPLALKLHFPASTQHDPVEPAFTREEGTDVWRYGNETVVRLLERAFLQLAVRDPDEDRALALLGIAVHVLQDSCKHRGFCGRTGHIGQDPDPDDPAQHPGISAEVSDLTFLTLSHAYRIRTGKPPAPAGRVRVPDIESWQFAPSEWNRLYANWEERGGRRAFVRALRIVREVLQ